MSRAAKDAIEMADFHRRMFTYDFNEGLDSRRLAMRNNETLGHVIAALKAMAAPTKPTKKRKRKAK